MWVEDSDKELDEEGFCFKYCHSKEYRMVDCAGSCGATLNPLEEWISDQDECFECYSRLQAYRLKTGDIGEYPGQSEESTSCTDCGFVMPNPDMLNEEGVCQTCVNGFVRYVCSGRECFKTVILHERDERDHVVCEDCHLKENY